MKSKAQKIWEVFKGELIDNEIKDGEDVKQALATSIREIVNEYQYYQFLGEGEDMVVSARLIYDLADELEDLND